MLLTYLFHTWVAIAKTDSTRTHCKLQFKVSGLSSWCRLVRETRRVHLRLLLILFFFCVYSETFIHRYGIPLTHAFTRLCMIFFFFFFFFLTCTSRTLPLPLGYMFGLRRRGTGCVKSALMLLYLLLILLLFSGGGGGHTVGQKKIQCNVMSIHRARKKKNLKKLTELTCSRSF